MLSKRGYLQQPDRIFTCAGRGTSGTITEFRHGLEANVALEIAYDAQIMDVWVLSPDSDEVLGDQGSLFLLSLGDRSSILYLSSDAVEIIEIGPGETEFNLASRTVAAGMHGPYMIQVTEESVVFTSRTETYVNLIESCGTSLICSIIPFHFRCTFLTLR